MDQIVIRASTSADLAAVDAIRIRGWQQGYRGILPEDYLQALMPHPDLAGRQRAWEAPAPPKRHAVAVADEEVVGFTVVGRWIERPAADDGPRPGPAGAIDAIFVDPDYWERGIGGRLLADATSYLAAQDLIPIRLWVLTANHRARRFYEARGFRCDDVTSPYRRQQGGHIAEATAVRYTLSP